MSANGNHTPDTRDPGIKPGSRSPFVELKGIVKRFGETVVLHGIDFELAPGEVHVLLGENGAGKSTLIQIIAGTLAPEEGDYHLHGVRIENSTPAKIRRAGVSAVFQEFSLVPELTVAENMFLGIETTRYGRLAKAYMNGAAAEMLCELGFDISPTVKIAGLRRAQKQMVEIAKAMIHKARVLIFDEPTASLADQEAATLFALIESLKHQGIGIIYITHRMAEIERLADRVTILRDGQVITTLARAEMNPARMVEAMTGRTFETFYPHIVRKPGAAVLKIADVTLASGLARGITLEARRGEVLGIAGLAGCGKSELVRSVFGLERAIAGRIFFDGHDITNSSPGKMLARGACYFPSDRAREGLAMGQSIRVNSTMAALDVPLFSRSRWLLRRKSEQQFALSAVERLRIKAAGTAAPAERLSGGNKQKLMLARGLSRDFHLYMFDEPTVGIDVQAKVEVYNFIKEVVEAGNAVIVVSSEMAEVIHLSHRVLVMHEGRQVCELDGAGITEDAILSSIFHQRELVA